MASKAVDILADQMAEPREGSYLPTQLVMDLKLASPESLTRLAGGLAERLARAHNPQTRLNAILALGEIGPQAAVAVRAAPGRNALRRSGNRGAGHRGPGES